MEFFCDGAWYLLDRYGGTVLYHSMSTSTTPALSGWEITHNRGAPPAPTVSLAAAPQQQEGAAAAARAPLAVSQQQQQEEDELAAAVAASLVSVPKTFATSRFLAAYSQPQAKPKRQSQLMEAVHALVTRCALPRG